MASGVPTVLVVVIVQGAEPVTTSLANVKAADAPIVGLGRHVNKVRFFSEMVINILLIYSCFTMS